jgi:NADPH2:quinone reductase
VNPIDTYIRAGAVAMDLPKPFIIGCDLAGVVLEVSDGVSQVKPGDRVWASNQGLLGRQGTFAERVAVKAEWLHQIPTGASFEAAAALALVGITAHLGLVTRAHLKQGEVLFVNGGTGGVGSTVVQMAKALGAQVITTAGSDGKVAVCRELGADLALNYRTANVPEEIRRFASRGVDVWWETLREPDFEKAIALLAPRGRMIVMAGREARPTFPVGPFYVKGCALHGFAMFAYTAAEQQGAGGDLTRWMGDGTLKARIDRVMPLAQAAQAHRLQEENTLEMHGTLAGKIVVRM